MPTHCIRIARRLHQARAGGAVGSESFTLSSQSRLVHRNQAGALQFAGRR